MHEINHIQVGKIIILKWHHANIYVACLSTEEGHTPPGSPLGKLLLLKINKTAKRKHQEHFWKSPEILNSSEKSHLWWAVRFPFREHNAKRINSFGLMVKKLKLFEALWNINEFESKNSWGGDVEGVNPRGATTRTASRVYWVAD